MSAPKTFWYSHRVLQALLQGHNAFFRGQRPQHHTRIGAQLDATDAENIARSLAQGLASCPAGQETSLGHLVMENGHVAGLAIRVTRSAEGAITHMRYSYMDALNPNAEMPNSLVQALFQAAPDAAIAQARPHGLLRQSDPHSTGPIVIWNLMNELYDLRYHEREDKENLFGINAENQVEWGAETLRMRDLTVATHYNMASIVAELTGEQARQNQFATRFSLPNPDANDPLYQRYCRARGAVDTHRGALVPLYPHETLERLRAVYLDYLTNRPGTQDRYPMPDIIRNIRNADGLANLRPFLEDIGEEYTALIAYGKELAVPSVPYCGIGTWGEILPEGYKISEVFTQSPAAKLGLREGDTILSVMRDGVEQPLRGMDTMTMLTHIRGSPEHEAVLKVRRADGTVEVLGENRDIRPAMVDPAHGCLHSFIQDHEEHHRFREVVSRRLDIAAPDEMDATLRTDLEAIRQNLMTLDIGKGALYEALFKATGSMESVLAHGPVTPDNAASRVESLSDLQAARHEQAQAERLQPNGFRRG